MTNEETIKSLKKLKSFHNGSYGTAIAEAIKAIEQTRWIPVSERLPENEGYYLTTTMYHEVFCDYWNKERFERTETIIAWMPLPEPYVPDINVGKMESEDKGWPR